MPRSEHKTRESTALVASLCVFVVIAFAVVSCGDEDLFFPGDLPPTGTAEPESTDTPTPNGDPFAVDR